MPALFALSLLSQVVAVALALIAWSAATPVAWGAVAIYLVVASLFATLWTKLLGDMRIKEKVADAREHYLSQRERIRVQAEQEKLGLVREAHDRVWREANRNATRANLKVGAVAALAVALGVALVAVQLFTLGALALSAAGGGMAGYLLRVGQERRRRARELARALIDPPRLLEDESARAEPPA